MRRVIVTGGASGLGLETALELARRGDHVIVADRNVDGGRLVVQRIVGDGGRAEFRALDLADLAGVRRFAEDELREGLPLAVLVNNAGLLPPMDRTTTRDGFELAFGIAFLGHFALTALLMPGLLRDPGPRVVTLASISHTSGRLDFGNLQLERGYAPSQAYANSKLACLTFALELHRRAAAAGSSLASIAAHPGVASTPIASGWEREDRRSLRHRGELIGYRIFIKLFGQTAEQGAQATILAATSPDLAGGSYVGPTRFGQTRGPIGLVRASKTAQDPAIASRLWAEAERLTGARFEIPSTPRQRR